MPEPRDPDLGELQDEADGEGADEERRADDGDNCQVEVAAEERLMLEDDSEGDPFDQDNNQTPDDNSQKNFIIDDICKMLLFRREKNVKIACKCGN